ncbi:AAA family ATPase [Edaphobacter albus]|uniref:AAA family ATPase n=1 Tax=Edaphobacter sp. 4G125 TaxID=2763071 RepID=UPI001648D22E|nr:AAA family ATPase [Edaphobacter sp. 4G125]QNI35289.1 AAA family ATPase [Edaphobacter sp. 4G125]
MSSPKRIVISGGPGAGKTTLLEELRRRGYACSPEVARQIIQEQVHIGGNALPWGDREAYSRLMLARSVASWESSVGDSRIIFFDRGIPDTLCYVRLVGLSSSVEEEALQMCQQYRYWSRVFLAPPWREIYENDTERKQDFDEAIRTYELMAQTYRECGYEVVILPQVSAAERAEVVLRQIEDASLGADAG